MRRYAHNQKIGKPKNVKCWGSKLINGPQQDGINQQRSLMSEGGEYMDLIDFF
jgi:hypothetical protein